MIVYLIWILFLLHIVNSKYDRTNKLISESLTTASDGTKVKHLSFNGKTNISLVCCIPPGQYYVVWEKLESNDNIPLTIGENRFTKDSRFSINHKYPEKWTLTIDEVQKKDSGIYTCSTTDGRNGPTPGFEDETEESFEPVDFKPSKIFFNVTIVNDGIVKPVSSPQIINDEREIKPTTTKIEILGPKIALYGSRINLKCQVTFSNSNSPKTDSFTQIEWYQNGFRVKTSLTRSISVKRIDSNKVESLLIIDRVFPQDSGTWICLQKSERNYNGIVDVIAFEKIFLEVVDLPDHYVPISQMNSIYKKSLSLRHIDSNHSSRTYFVKTLILASIWLLVNII